MRGNLLSKELMQGLEAARERGRVGGRPCGLSKTALLKAKLAVIEYNKYLQLKDRTINDVCIIVGVSKATLYKYLKLQGITIRNK